MGVNSLPKTVIRQRRGSDLNPGPSAPESSTLTTRLPSHLAHDDSGLSGLVTNRVSGEGDRSCPSVRCFQSSFLTNCTVTLRVYGS